MLPRLRGCGVGAAADWGGDWGRRRAEEKNVPVWDICRNCEASIWNKNPPLKKYVYNVKSSVPWVLSWALTVLLCARQHAKSSGFVRKQYAALSSGSLQWDLENLLKKSGTLSKTCQNCSLYISRKIVPDEEKSRCPQSGPFPEPPSPPWAQALTWMPVNGGSTSGPSQTCPLSRAPACQAQGRCLCNTVL